MPFVFLIVGLVLLVIGVRQQTTTAIGLLKSEFTGANSFIQWFIAIMIIGLIGYWKPARPVADGFLALLILVMILDNQTKNNLFGLFENALQNTKASTATPASTTTSTGNPVTSPTPGANTATGSVLSSGALGIISALGGSSPGQTVLSPTENVTGQFTPTIASPANNFGLVTTDPLFALPS